MDDSALTDVVGNAFQMLDLSKSIDFGAFLTRSGEATLNVKNQLIVTARSHMENSKAISRGRRDSDNTRTHELNQSDPHQAPNTKGKDGQIQ